MCGHFFNDSIYKPLFEMSHIITSLNKYPSKPGNQNTQTAMTETDGGGELVRAVAAYAAQRDDELGIEVGDVIEVVKKFEDSWWRGRLNGKEGFFPSTFTKPQQTNAEEVHPEKTSQSKASTKSAKQEAAEEESEDEESEEESEDDSEEEEESEDESEEAEEIQPPKLAKKQSSASVKSAKKPTGLINVQPAKVKIGPKKKKAIAAPQINTTALRKGNLSAVSKASKTTAKGATYGRYGKPRSAISSFSKGSTYSYRTNITTLRRGPRSATSTMTKGASILIPKGVMDADELRRYRDILGQKDREIEALKAENRQDKAIRVMDLEKGDLPRILQSMSEELRMQKDKTREYRERHAQSEKHQKAQHEEIMSLKKKITSMEKFLKQKNIDPATMGKKATKELAKKDELIEDLRHKLALLQKSKESAAEIDKLRSEIEKYKEILRGSGNNRATRTDAQAPKKTEKSPKLRRKSVERPVDEIGDEGRNMEAEPRLPRRSQRQTNDETSHLNASMVSNAAPALLANSPSQNLASSEIAPAYPSVPTSVQPQLNQLSPQLQPTQTSHANVDINEIINKMRLSTAASVPMAAEPEKKPALFQTNPLPPSSMPIGPAGLQTQTQSSTVPIAAPPTTVGAAGGFKFSFVDQNQPPYGRAKTDLNNPFKKLSEPAPSVVPTVPITPGNTSLVTERKFGPAFGSTETIDTPTNEPTKTVPSWMSVAKSNGNAEAPNGTGETKSVPSWMSGRATTSGNNNTSTTADTTPSTMATVETKAVPSWMSKRTTNTETTAGYTPTGAGGESKPSWMGNGGSNGGPTKPSWAGGGADPNKPTFSFLPKK
ncbi:SH3 domain-containing kinase-binding protein 1-like [Planoprotostelium fungivorum]|uniref:SH3 domain-containing kinase-binding protein 1-like n=1 Tax=Planoprotostelium fungivorum TaxID=1890364 RepID=A0A2P6MRD9_9EUKA|nr:SH3 domain-containing kinase-binding protein 1-like [Planoprotostelium fungivorum]